MFVDDLQLLQSISSRMFIFADDTYALRISTTTDHEYLQAAADFDSICLAKGVIYGI